MCLFCLFYWCLLSLSGENFSIWRPLPLKGFIFRPILGVWPLNSERSLIRNTYWDTWPRFSWSHQNDSWHSRLLLSVSQWNCHNLFSRLRSRDWNLTPISCMQSDRLNNVFSFTLGCNVSRCKYQWSLNTLTKVVSSPRSGSSVFSLMVVSRLCEYSTETGQESLFLTHNWNKHFGKLLRICLDFT